MAADEASKLEAETQDEIEQIMNEIEDLQAEMEGSSASAAAPQASAQVPVSGPTSEEDDRSMHEFVTVDEDVPAPTADSVQQASAAEASVVEEVSGTEDASESISESSDSDEPWVEETLAEFDKPERQSSRAASSAQAAPTRAGSSSGRITLGVQGALEVCLKHETTGLELTVEFAGEFIRVCASNGAEFKVPLQAVRSLRRVA